MSPSRIELEPSPPASPVVAPAPQVAPGRSGWGAAVDVGTTTLVVAAHSLEDGSLLGSESLLNPQVEYGDDVLSRVSRAMAGEAEPIRLTAVRAVERLVKRAGAKAAGAPSELVLVGNPAMIHLLLGRDPSPLAAPPYQGVLVESLEMTATEAGLGAIGDATVRTAPAASAFVGADAIAGVAATGLSGRARPAMLVDLGTNGEIVLKTGEGLVAASAAAGPALEGGAIECGTRAIAGAIERASYDDGVLKLSTIANAPAQGICGSGLIDLVAALVRSGAVGPTGRIRMSSSLSDHVRVGDHGAEVDLVAGVYLTQQDIRALQLAKGAIATAIGMVLEQAGIAAEAVTEVIVGGAFGSRVDPGSLAAIGMIPPEWTGRVTFGGNTALRGAVAMLLDPSLLEQAKTLARGVRTVPLAARDDFQARFIASLDFPD